MNKKLGIRYEDRFKMERRVAIIPADARKLIESAGLEFYVERSEKRIFSDDEFSSAGAKIVDDVSEIPVIFGVKEMPVDYFRKNHTYIFFSHTIKGQEYNMPALKKMIEKEVNLIDYEKVTDEEGRRLIFFGRYAGLAGMINSLWALGKRLAIKGITNPFEKINQSHTYDSLEDAKNVIGDVAKEIIRGALSQLGKPLVVGFTGYGNVSQGAQEIIQLLPVEYVTPEQLKELALKGNWSGKKIYTVVFKEEHLVVPKDPAMDFELQDYYNNPSKYTSDFEQYIDKLKIGRAHV